MIYKIHKHDSAIRMSLINFYRNRTDCLSRSEHEKDRRKTSVLPSSEVARTIVALTGSRPVKQVQARKENLSKDRQKGAGERRRSRRGKVAAMKARRSTSSKTKMTITERRIARRRRKTNADAAETKRERREKEGERRRWKTRESVTRTLLDRLVSYCWRWSGSSANASLCLHVLLVSADPLFIAIQSAIPICRMPLSLFDGKTKWFLIILLFFFREKCIMDQGSHFITKQTENFPLLIVFRVRLSEFLLFNTHVLDRNENDSR